jgi:hypothetical protein
MSTTVSFDVKVIDGEGLPVPAVEVGARYKYASGPRTWSAEYTDGDGHASFRDDHPDKPIEVSLFVDDEDCGPYEIVEGCHITVEM